MINKDYVKYDIIMRVGTPSRRKDYNGPKIDLDEILQAIENTDIAFPLKGYTGAHKWRASVNNYDREEQAFRWQQGLFTLQGFRNLFYQGGWNLPIFHWKYVPTKRVVDISNYTTKPN